MGVWIKRDLKHNWHPCAHMKDFETIPPLLIEKAQGVMIELADGRQLIDGIASWWCKSLGHQHPQLKAALLKQLECFEHVMFGNTTHETIILLAEQLAKLTQGQLDKAFYASDGSCAVEIALKMAYQAQQIQGYTKRKHFMALAHSYHGETALALSVSDLGLYRSAYEDLLTPVCFIQNIPYVYNTDDPLWHDCSSIWPGIEAQLDLHQDTLAAIIVEPLVQGAGGMLIYSADFLKRLRVWTQVHGIYLIADEMMTGLWRTGLPLACQHADIIPDLLCLGKGLTSGMLPLSVVLTSTDFFKLFYDADKNQAFLHSHTHSGNALAASVALATLTVMAEPHMPQQIAALSTHLAKAMQTVAEQTGLLTQVRHLGVVAAATIASSIDPKILSDLAAKHGALLRPIGQTLYWLPPLIMTTAEVDKLADISQKAILSEYRVSVL